MYRLTLKCRLITPMFMAGADGRTPELRPSEFKGMMRWWWRAIKAENDIEKLRKEEAEIFGGTGEGQGKSKIRIETRTTRIFPGTNISEEIDELAGLRYLYYSTFSLRARGIPIIREYFRPETEFEISISAFDEKSFSIARASLWLSIYLGGFGTRARRGGGNIEVIEIRDIDIKQNIKFICEAENVSKLKKFLEENLTNIREICNISKNVGPVNYTNLKNTRILIFEPKNDWKSALNFLGEHYKMFRDKNKNEIFKTASFGMPVMHSRFSIRMVPYDNNRKRLSDRWASPLIFKVIKTNEGFNFPIIIKLSPGGVNYIGKEYKRDTRWYLDNNNIQKYDENLLSLFFNSLPNEKEELAL